MPGADGGDLSVLFDPESRPDPYPAFAQLRTAGPFAVMDGALVVLGGYATIAALLRDPSMSSDRRKARPAARRADAAEEPVVSFLSLDPPDHTRLRGLVSKAFTPRVIAELRPRITEIVEQRLTAIGELASADVVAELAYPLPVQIISELLGVPASDRDRIEGWSRRLVRGLDPMMSLSDPDVLADIEAADVEFESYFSALIEQRRRSPGIDLLSRLVRIEEAGEVLSHDELLATCTLLLVAGHETTSNLIANGMLALVRHPEALAALRARPDLIDGVVEETLRYDPPVQLSTRIATRDTVISGLEVGAGAVTLLLLGAANRDPMEFPDPEEFDPRRSPPHHLSFAAGPHFCLGAGLARLESSIALAAFARRAIHPQLVDDGLSYRPHITLRGPQELRLSVADMLPAGSPG